MDLNWRKCAGNWCELEALDCTTLRGHGVYVVWKPASAAHRPSSVVRVGHGDLAISLEAVRRDPAVNRQGPGLLVTWANVGPIYSGGIEVFLTQQLKPLLGERFPFAAPVEVNLPIGA